MYRMALDQIPTTGREVRYKIMRNIGNAFVRLGQFQDAIASYEQVQQLVLEFAGIPFHVYPIVHLPICTRNLLSSDAT